MRAVVFVALWLVISAPLALVVGAFLRQARASELAEQVDLYLRRMARGRRPRVGRGGRIALVSVVTVAFAAGSLRYVSDVPQRIIVAGIENAEFFGPGPGTERGPSTTRRAAETTPTGGTAAPPTLRPPTDVFGEPLTADDLGIPAPSLPPASPAAGGRPGAEGTSPDDDGDDPATREQPAFADSGASEPVSEPGPDDDERDATPSGGGGGSRSDSTTTTAPPPTTTTSTTAAPTTTTTTPPTTTTSTTSTTTTSTTSTTAAPTTTTTTAPPATTTTTAAPPPTTTTTTAPAEEPPSDTADDETDNGNAMGSIDHEPASVEAASTDSTTTRRADQPPALDRSTAAEPVPIDDHGAAVVVMATDDAPPAVEPDPVAIPEPEPDELG